MLRARKSVTASSDRLATSWPHTSMPPAVGLSMQPIRLRSVVLPLPLRKRTTGDELSGCMGNLLACVGTVWCQHLCGTERYRAKEIDMGNPDPASARERILAAAFAVLK